MTPKFYVLAPQGLDSYRLALLTNRLHSNGLSPSDQSPIRNVNTTGCNDQHFLSACVEYRTYLCAACLTFALDDKEFNFAEYTPSPFLDKDEHPPCTSARTVSRRVSTKQSPHFKAFGLTAELIPCHLSYYFFFLHMSRSLKICAQLELRTIVAEHATVARRKCHPRGVDIFRFSIYPRQT